MKTETKRVITPEQRISVYGLLALAKQHKEIADQCEAALQQIVEPDLEDPWGGHSGDAIWSEYSAEELLRKTGCVVKNAK